MPPPPITLTETGRTDHHGDAVLLATGAIEGWIAVGYRLHHCSHGPVWHLRIQLAPVLNDPLGAYDTSLVIGHTRFHGGVLHHQVHPPLRTWPEHHVATAADDDTPSLEPLIVAVLNDWHSADRLAAADTDLQHHPRT